MGALIIPSIAELLLNLADSLKVGCAVKSVTTVQQKLHQVLGHIATGHIQTLSDMREGISLNNWNNVGHAIS